MLSKSAIVSLALTAMLPGCTLASTPCKIEESTPSPFHWGSCEFADTVDTTAEYECSNFTVPLDYLNTTSDKTLTLQLMRVPAINGDSLGTIFFNFGGPGFEARQHLAESAEQILVVTEGKFDLVAVDPRGTGNVAPFKCYNDTTRPLIMPKHRVQDAYGPAEKTNLARLWASVANIAYDCKNSDESAPDMGDLIGTGYVARDMMLVKDTLVGPDALLNYWGISYGTVLGATAAAMFPDKVGRMMLDGNVNIPQWYDGYDTVWWSDADNAVYDFFERCVEAGPELCVLAGRNESANVLNERLYDVMDQLRTYPIPVGAATVLDTSSLKYVFSRVLSGRELLPTFAVVLNELFKPTAQRNLAVLSKIWAPMSQATDELSHLTDEALFGISCSDKRTRTDSFDDVLAVSKELVGVSKALGEVPNNTLYLCQQWPFHARGAPDVSAWTDNTQIQTANPLLFIGPRYDPVTPIVNAHNNSAVFSGSGVLTHIGVGHTVNAHPSLCTARVIRMYFHNGTLPDAGGDATCTADFDAFDLTKTWQDVYLPELGWE